MRTEARHEVAATQRKPDELCALQQQVLAQLTTVRALLDWTLPQMPCARPRPPREQRGRPATERRVPVGPGWALVGDAGYFKDPLTAHGITDALRDAELLADAVVAAADGDHGASEVYYPTRDVPSAELRGVTERIAGHRWDRAELHGLLRDLSAAQRAENRWLAARDQQGLAPAA